MSINNAFQRGHSASDTLSPEQTKFRDELLEFIAKDEHNDKLPIVGFRLVKYGLPEIIAYPRLEIRARTVAGALVAVADWNQGRVCEYFRGGADMFSWVNFLRFKRETIEETVKSLSDFYENDEPPDDEEERRSIYIQKIPEVEIITPFPESCTKSANKRE